MTLLRKAKERSWNSFVRKGVWRATPRSRTRCARITGTRWVCCNKGDAQNPDVRCPFVCQGVNTYDSDKFSAATPLLEALRMSLSFATGDRRRQVSSVDISLAYLNALIKRTVYVSGVMLQQVSDRKIWSFYFFCLSDSTFLRLVCRC